MTPLKPGRPAILARLREGRLPSGQFQGIAASANSLKVQVCKLRVAGHDIRTEREDGSPWKKGGVPGRCGSRPAFYRLVEEETA